MNPTRQTYFEKLHDRMQFISLVKFEKKKCNDVKNLPIKYAKMNISTKLTSFQSSFPRLATA